AALDRGVGDLLLVGAGAVGQHPQLAEHEGHRAFGAEVAAELAEGVAYVGHGAHAVVGQAVDDHRHAAGRVALVADLLVLHALQLAGRLLDRALDHVLGHVDRQALVDRGAQARVAAGVAAAGAGGDADLADDLGENLAALRVGGVLACFDGRTASHGWSRFGRRADYTFVGAPACSKRPSRRKATVWRAASADRTRPVWLHCTRQWSCRPGSRVSAIPTVPSDSR